MAGANAKEQVIGHLLTRHRPENIIFLALVKHNVITDNNIPSPQKEAQICFLIILDDLFNVSE